MGKSSNLIRIKRHYINHSQLPMGIVTTILVAAFGAFLHSKSSTLSFFWITGIGFGFILQKSRFCFTSAIRDPYLTGSTSLTKALLIALAVTSIGFTFIKYQAFFNGHAIPGQNLVTNLSFATMAGGLLFGIGMVLAGGCASGVLMRTGEGFLTQMVALVFFIIGLMLGARDFGWWHEKFISHSHPIFLPDIFGWFGALAVQLLFIAILFFIADRWEKKKNRDF